MDLEKIIEFAGRYLSDYINAFMATLCHPVVQFSPVYEGAPGIAGGLTHPRQAAVTRLNPQIFTFGLLSIAIGLTLSKVLPTKTQVDPLVAVTLIFILWTIFACYGYVIAKLFRGGGTFNETVTVTLQVLGVVYVLCNIIALLGRVIVSAGLVYLDIEAVDFLYFVAQATLFSIYMPLAMKGLHRVSRWKTLLLYGAFWALWVLPFAAMSIVVRETSDVFMAR